MATPPASLAALERRPFGRQAWAGLAVVAALLLPGCAALDAKQRQWVFQPSDRAWGGSIAAAAGMTDVWIDFDSRETGQPVRLHGLWLPQEARPEAPVLLYLHGARWDVRGSAPRMRRLHDLGFAVLGVDYRGFGRSDNGTLPSEAMAYEDARAAWDWLAQQHPERQRYVFGHSLGGAIAIHLAAGASDVAGLMVEGTFTSVPDVIGTFKWGWLPVSPFVTQRFDSASRIGQVRAPVLVVHGSEDQLIRPELGRALYERAPAPKRWVLVPGGSHHSTNAVGADDYRQ
ncbi:MAG: alpha/beta hydrolase, partial [Aquabacterium sp.]